MMKLICNGLAINHDTRRVFVDGRTVSLSPGEYEIMKVLASRPGKVAMIQIGAVPSRTKQMVYRLRRRIGKKWIESIRGKGYRLGTMDII